MHRARARRPRLWPAEPVALDVDGASRAGPRDLVALGDLRWLSMVPTARSMFSDGDGAADGLAALQGPGAAGLDELVVEGLCPGRGPA
jgi:hypothetical protein